MSYFDEEAIYYERLDADMEQAALEQTGREHRRRQVRASKLFASGDIRGAAKACPHGGGYPLHSPAATNSHDPRAYAPDLSKQAFRCLDCGSILSADPWSEFTIIDPCSLAVSR